MSLLNLPRTVGSLRRLRQIGLVLLRHGFAHVLGRLHLADVVPGFARLRVRIEELAGSDPELNAAERLALAFQELGATFIKLGQLLATRPDLVPPDFVAAFARLQDRVDPLPGPAIRGAVEAALGASIPEVFASFEETALASGSIGQAHSATLRDGTPVLVKIKRPGTDARVREDLDLLAGLASLVEKRLPELAVLQPQMVTEEFSRLMERELDFVGEASAAERFGRDFADDPGVAAPRVFWDSTGRDLLVLERMEGVRADPAALAAAGLDPRPLAATLARCMLRQYFVTGFFHADPHPGNLLARDGGRLALVDFGQTGHLPEDLRRQLALTVVALAEGDVDFIVDTYAEIGAFSERTDLRRLRTELRSLLDRHYGVPLDRLDVATAFQEALGLARAHGIRLPRDFVLLAKSFVTLTGVLRALDPGFRIDEAVRPFTTEMWRSFASPRSIGRRAGFFLVRLHALARRIPEDARDILGKLRAGQIRIIFHHEGLEEPAAQFERAVNRLTLGLLIGAITVGSSIVLAAGDRALGTRVLPLVGDTPIAVIASVLGFSLAILLGLWVAWGILRGRR